VVDVLAFSLLYYVRKLKRLQTYRAVLAPQSFTFLSGTCSETEVISVCFLAVPVRTESPPEGSKTASDIQQDVLGMDAVAEEGDLAE
jgi:hypothetical protein